MFFFRVRQVPLLNLATHQFCKGRNQRLPLSSVFEFDLFVVEIKRCLTGCYTRQCQNKKSEQFFHLLFFTNYLMELFFSERI